MNLLKKIIAGGLLAGSVTFAVLIIASNNPSPSASANSLAEMDQLRSETIPDVTTDSAQNLTESASQAIGDSIIASGATSADQLQSPEEIAAEYLAEASKNFDYNSLKPAVSYESLKIISTSDARLISIYTKGLGDTLNSVFGSLKPSDTDIQTNLRMMSEAYDKIIASLYAMPVPQIFGRLHQGLIANLGGQKAAADMIRNNLGSDPLRALLGLQAVDALTAELLATQKTITDLAGQN